MPVSLKHRLSTVTPRLDQIKDPVLAQVLNDFAKNIQQAFQNIYDDLNTVGKTKALNFTRDLTAVSGDVKYAGFGFKPRSVLFFAGIEAAAAASWGFSDGAKHLDLNSEAITAADQMGADSTTCINLLQAAGKTQTAIVKSLDADGFTLTWTKTSTPTGTAKIFCLAFA